MNCASCGDKECYKGKDCTKFKNKLDGFYSDEQNKKIMKISTEIEGKYYMKATRLEEIIMFSKKMAYERIGIAFCIGLSEEARVIKDIFKSEKFKVFSVCCKICGIDKKKYKLKQIREDRFEAMCDPIGQAEALKIVDTDLNIILGLCVGHDMLFTKYSHTLVTTLIAKDRVLAHNPAGAIYSPYHRRKFL